MLCLTTPFHRLVALKAETGRELWSFDPRIDRNLPSPMLGCRGAAFWRDGAGAKCNKLSSDAPVDFARP